MTDTEILNAIRNPTDAHIESMCVRYNHGFGLLPEGHKKGIRMRMRQLHEEATGQGFYRIPGEPVVFSACMTCMVEDVECVCGQGTFREIKLQPGESLPQAVIRVVAEDKAKSEGSNNVNS